MLSTYSADLSVLAPTLTADRAVSAGRSANRGASGRRPSGASLPTRLRPADLLRLTDEGANGVLDGRFDHLIPDTFPTLDRWSTRLHADDDVDVWLISWVPERNTELHDHAGSFGALTVLSGSLTEFRWAGDAWWNASSTPAIRLRSRSDGFTMSCVRRMLPVLRSKSALMHRL